jgi:hypothetical protein
MDQLYRSLLAIDPNTNLPISTNYIMSTDGTGNIKWQNILYNISSYGQNIGYLPSTLNTLNTYMYNISTGVLPGSLSTPNLTSTVNGLGRAGYISSQTLYSTINGLGTLGYLSSAFFGSTVTGLGTTGYVSSLTLYSTIKGLGSYGYLSTVTNLGSLGYVSSSTLQLSLQSSLVGLGNLGYVSTDSILYVIRNLGTFGYVSTASLVSTTTVLTSNLLSSVTNILNNRTNYYLNAANALVIGGNNVNVIISTLSSAYFYDTFNNSSIKYKGNNGNQLAYNSNNSDFYISTLNLQLATFSNYIHGNTNVSIEVYPNILFPALNTSANPKVFHISTIVSYGASTLGTNIAESKFLAINTNSSNLFQQPLRINITGATINSNYASNYQLTHRILNAYNYGGADGFPSSNVSLFFSSTASYYLSIQNITY